MQGNQGALQGTDGRSRNGLIPSTRGYATLQSICHNAEVYRCHSRRKPKAIWANSQQFTIFSVNLIDLFLEEEAPDWIAGLPTLLRTGYELIQLFLLEIHTPTGSGFEVYIGIYILKITDT